MNSGQSIKLLKKIIVSTISLFLIGSGALLADQSGFDGYWRSTFGHISLKTNGSQVSGTYSNGKAKGKVVGTLSSRGNLLIGKWVENAGSGKFVFKLQDGSNSFVGKWGKKNELLNGRWNGVREKKAVLFKQAKPSDFVGEWNTNFGKLVLDADENNNIIGVFSGKVNNGTVKAQFDAASGKLNTEWRDDKHRGQATFQLLEGKNGLYGEWWYQNEQYGGAWIGVRAASAVGCVDGNCEEGDGVYVWTDGSRYEGHWRKGAPHGVGRAYNSDAQLEKNGLWLNGVYQAKILSGNLAEGNGKIKFTNGDIYTGQFKDLVPSGNGKIVYRNGNVFDGEVLNGKPNGEGSFLEKESGDRYQGVFRRGLLQGSGTLKLANGQKYEGKFRQGEPYGNGKMTWKDGSRYEGDWRNGKPSGTGMFYYSNGDQYTGSLKDGLKDGDGVYVFANGDTVSGTWRHDQIETVREEKHIAQTAKNAQSGVEKHAYFENNPLPELTNLFHTQNRAYLVYQMQEKKLPFIDPHPISNMVGDNKELHLTYFVVHGADTLSEASIRSFIADMTKTNVDDFKLDQIVNNRNDVNKTINQYRFGLHKARIYISGGEHFYYSEDRFALTQ